ncbi:AraC family transcriptional regulator [Tsukamurella soli]|uniref:AraC family transcriptional regulator n=1 Tax=Tsukamurella soli TaxID=644556 RepID=A0ABP8JAM1_9ACTN
MYDHRLQARSTGTEFARTVVVPPWGVKLGGSIELAVHAVTRGTAWLWVESAADAVRLSPGEVALVRGGVEHFIAHEAGAACLDPDEFRRRQAPSPAPLHGDATVFLCGAYRFTGDVTAGLLDALPPVLTLAPATGEPLHDVIGLISRELAAGDPGRQTVLDRLLDVLLVLALRTDLQLSPAAPRWWRAVSDLRLRDALRAVHEDLSYAWTVDELAGLSGMSRAAFARTFREVLGQPPMQYVTDRRMSVARDMLRTTDKSLIRIATEVGYASQYSFTAAFRRAHGTPPGAWRQQSASAPLTVDDTACRPAG